MSVFTDARHEVGAGTDCVYITANSRFDEVDIALSTRTLTKTLRDHDYSVGWISALALEMAAAKAMLDDTHAALPIRENDNNVYHLGEIAGHNIVIACLPSGVYGQTSATAAAMQMRSTFPSIKLGLMVGIGGGAPNGPVDVRLGDIVVSKPTAHFGGVVQYDFGKTLADGVFYQTGVLNKPPEALLKAVSHLQANHIMGQNKIYSHMAKAAVTYPSMRAFFLYPGQDQDTLYQSSYPHQGPSTSACESVCHPMKRVTRPQRQSTLPEIHYGLIASANQVMRDARTRDRLTGELGILCYDMEAAGLMDHFPCLVIRGICDYADSHKDKTWQNYAAATAAAYAKELLGTCIPSTLRYQDCPGNVKMRVPIPRAEIFGRENELRQMQEYINSADGLSKPLVIYGLSGCGKTQLAIHYVTSEKETYESILWVNASSTSVIRDSFEQISSLVSSDFCPTNPSVERVLGWLEQESNCSWIIIFDNIPNVGDTGWNWHGDFDIRPYLPSCDHGHILLVTTSCYLHSRLDFPGIHLQGVDDHAGSEIMLRCANIKSADYLSRTTAKSISRKLGGLPLALEQAGSFLSYGLISMQEYMRRFESKYLDETLKTHTRRYIGSYEKGLTLWTVFDMLHEALAKTSPDSLRLLYLAVCLGPGPVPFRHLSGFVTGNSMHCPETSDGTTLGIISWLETLLRDFRRLSSALGDLESTGFVKLVRNSPDNLIETIVIHDLIQTFIRAKIPRHDMLENTAAALLLNGIPFVNDGMLKDNEVMRTHSHKLNMILNSFLSMVPQDMLQPPQGKYFALFGTVVPPYARVCRLKGELVKARDLWEARLQYCLVTEGSQWPRTQVQLIELLEAADVDFKLGSLDSAIEKYMSVIRHCEPEIPEKDNIAIRASSCLREAREIYVRRENDFQRAILSQRSTKRAPEEGNESVDVEDGEWEMIMRYEEALNLFGRRDSETIQHAEALAAYYKEFARTHKEEMYREIVWRYYVFSAGDSHPTTVARLHDLCVCYRENGKLRDKLRWELYLAPVWVRNHKAPELKNLLLEGETPDILIAFNNGDKDAFWNLLNRHDPKAVISWASELENTDIRDMLFYHFAKTNMSDVCHFLHLTADSGKCSASHILPMWDMDDYQPDIDSSRALHHALRWGFNSIVQALLENGVVSTYADSYGETALHYAIKRSDLLMVLLLLEHGADTTQSDCYGRTALHHAIKGKAIPIVKTLLEYGVNTSQRDNRGETAVHYAVKDRELSLLLTFLEHGVNISQADSFGRTALHYAIRGRDTVIIKSLLGHGDIINKRDNHGETALHYAARGRDASKVYLLLEYGAAITMKDKQGQTALHYAAREGRELAVQAILEFGGDTNQADNDGRTSLHYGAQAGQGLFQMLLKYGGEVSRADRHGRLALHYAAENGSTDIVKAILDRGIGVDSADYSGDTPLHFAARQGKQDIIHMLLETDANSFVENTLGCTALETAFLGGHKKTIELILSHTLDKRDLRGQTFLHRIAQCRDNTDLFYLVIELSHGIIDATDNSDRTALHVAAARGNLFAVQILLENGGDFRLQNYENHTPLDEALMQMSSASGVSKRDLALEEVIRLLQKAGSGFVKEKQPNEPLK